jgi:hypothetical protein
MRRYCFAATIAIAVFPSVFLAQAATDGPYKVLKTARVGGEGGTDYIFADVAGRRIYITRGAVRAPATDTSPARVVTPARVTVFDIETLAPAGVIEGIGGNGAVVDPKSGHGFTSSSPSAMFDTKNLTMLKMIDAPAGAPTVVPPVPGFRGDGIYFDSFNDRVYIFSHPSKDAQAIDAKDGTVLGIIPLPGVPEQAVSDGKGTLYVVMQANSPGDSGGVAVVDVKSMKSTAFYSFGGNQGCNGLALDVKNKVLFAACGRVGPAPQRGQPGDPPPPPPTPQMIILSAVNGKIITKLPLAGGSDGAAFNPATMEAFSSHSNGTMTIVKENSPSSFEVEQNLNTMLGARTLTLDTKTNRLFVMSVERGPAPPPPAAGGRGGQAPVIPGSFTILMIGKPEIGKP